MILFLLPVLLAVGPDSAPASGAQSGTASLGVPVMAPYGFPEGYQADSLEASEDWTVLERSPDGFLIVPLALDTLRLPDLAAVSPDGADTVIVPHPVIVVGRTMPDSVCDATVFPAPLPMDIPPGYPSDYLHRLAFWRTWGVRGRAFPWLPVAAGALVAVLAVWFLSRRRKPSGVPAGVDISYSPSSFEKAALALLDSKLLAAGDFKALYREIDLLLRRLFRARSGIDMEALTYRQIHRRLTGRKDLKWLVDGSDGLAREIGLQRYADWGTTREKAQADIRRLAELGKAGPRS